MLIQHWYSKWLIWCHPEIGKPCVEYHVCVLCECELVRRWDIYCIYCILHETGRERILDVVPRRDGAWNSG